MTFLSFFLGLLGILSRPHCFKGWNSNGSLKIFETCLDVPHILEIQANPTNPTRQTSVFAFCCRLARQWGRSALGTSTCYLTLDKAPTSGLQGYIWSTLNPVSQTVTDGHRRSQTVTDGHRRSQTVTDDHRRSQTVTDCHRLSQIVTDCHRPSHKLSVFLVPGQDCKNMLAVNYWNATIGVFGQVLMKGQSQTILD